MLIRLKHIKTWKGK